MNEPSALVDESVVEILLDETPGAIDRQRTHTKAKIKSRHINAVILTLFFFPASAEYGSKMNPHGL